MSPTYIFVLETNLTCTLRCIFRESLTFHSWRPPSTPHKLLPTLKTQIFHPFVAVPDFRIVALIVECLITQLRALHS